MNKQDQIISGYREIYHKMVWLNKNKMEARLKEFKSSEVHCLEYIGKHADANVTKLSEAFFMTRGAMSKVTKKLMQKGVIESYQKPENKKEIYFKLTQKGRAVYAVHESLHEEFQERDKAVFEHVDEAQIETILHFMEIYSRHLDNEIKKADADKVLDSNN